MSTGRANVAEAGSRERLSASPLRVLLVGATGLVGARCLDALRRDAGVATITVLQRRAPAIANDARLRVLQADFDRLDALPVDTFQVDAAICALGTTIKVAGSQAAFRRVDHDYPLELARRVRAAGATRFGLVSALGANARSGVFYNRVKGEVEDAIAALGFDSLSMVRPSLLLGERAEVRFGERWSTPLMRHLPRRWRAVPGEAVAQSLVAAVLEGKPGAHRIENAELFERD